eukprot:gnl/MRDRNA2_/MRDRNA2_86209_c0_seq1.p1 gnl/MRDRNA2_/MRDRNA2_86209_c0~~gnl/MRDRNA2_/MRDRNA2_86209_c0_seq1.p1  ORF type:complete len:468 (+),score=-12.96 gnl/MRDRNA2_/MRDRNA2_86209_c0_seq1:946-2349(+)
MENLTVEIFAFNVIVNSLSLHQSGPNTLTQFSKRRQTSFRNIYLYAKHLDLSWCNLKSMFLSHIEKLFLNYGTLEELNLTGNVLKINTSDDRNNIINLINQCPNLIVFNADFFGINANFLHHFRIIMKHVANLSKLRQLRISITPGFHVFDFVQNGICLAKMLCHPISTLISIHQYRKINDSSWFCFDNLLIESHLVPYLWSIIDIFDDTKVSKIYYDKCMLRTDKSGSTRPRVRYKTDFEGNAVEEHPQIASSTSQNDKKSHGDKNGSYAVELKRLLTFFNSYLGHNHAFLDDLFDMYESVHVSKYKFSSIFEKKIAFLRRLRLILVPCLAKSKSDIEFLKNQYHILMAKFKSSFRNIPASFSKSIGMKNSKLKRKIAKCIVGKGLNNAKTQKKIHINNQGQADKKKRINDLMAKNPAKIILRLALQQSNYAVEKYLYHTTKSKKVVFLEMILVGVLSLLCITSRL